MIERNLQSNDSLATRVVRQTVKMMKLQHDKKRESNEENANAELLLNLDNARVISSDS